MLHGALEGLRGRDGNSLELVVYEKKGSHVHEGVLKESDGYWYPIIDGVPSMLRDGLRPSHEAFRARHQLDAIESGKLAPEAEAQLLTNSTFSDKWRRFRTYGLHPEHQEFLYDWYCKKIGVDSVDALKKFYSEKRRILEVGPGSGFNSRFMAQNTTGIVYALDISDAAFTAHENTEEFQNCHVIQGDLMDAPFEDGFFDFVIADGVLHHTPDTREAVRALYAKVKPGGQFFFYVYRQMGALRSFADEFVREQFSRLKPEACYQACEGLTELGRELSALNAEVTLEIGIPALGIPPGTHDVQRLFYYNVLKCFWNDAFDFETNNMVNFDWYHPHNAWQHSQEEVERWLRELGVTIYQFNNANPNGISVLLEKSRGLGNRAGEKGGG